MRAQLVALSGPLSGASVPLVGGDISIGRDEANDVTLADASVQPRHCVLASDRERLSLRNLQRSHPVFVNGLPVDHQTVEDGDEIQIGGSVFVLRFDEADERSLANQVRVEDAVDIPPPAIVLRREEAFTEVPSNRRVSATRATRDLGALIRISSAINAVRGLVELERPLLALIADAVPASRAALVILRDDTTDLGSAFAWSRLGESDLPIQVGRPLVERVLRELVGILSYEPTARSVLCAPLVAFDKPVGAIVLEAEGPDRRLDEGHLRLVMAVAGIAATALDHARQLDALAGLNRHLQAELNIDHNMVGDSPALRELYRRIARVAPTDSTVLITGESGTGKELIARAIHRNSPRGNQAFVAINCAAITETLLESELFGHEKGAFTGAIALKKGKLELADRGTVFLDEIGELSMALQAKLLRVLQEKTFDRVGGTRPVNVDFRLIAATNRDLKSSIVNGAFRPDLYYRLNVVSLATPPLRERCGDIQLLANWFLERHRHKARRHLSGFSAEALGCLTAYDWPGNVRELENAIEQAVVLGASSVILPEDFPDALAEAVSAAPDASSTLAFHNAIRETKKALILRAVHEAGGRYSAAAHLLGLHPNYLHRLIRNLQLKPTLKNDLGRDGGH